MSNAKKERKESASEDEESTSSSSDSSSDAAEKKRKHTKKVKHKSSSSTAKKAISKKKKNSKRASSESEESSGDSSSTSSSSASSSCGSDAESGNKKSKHSKPKSAKKTKTISPVRETKKADISIERTQNRDHSGHRESARSERDHNVFRQSAGGGDGGEQRRRRWSREELERSADKRSSRERDFIDRERGRERDHVGWRGGGGDQGGGRRANFNNVNRGYGGVSGNNGREQRFADRRDERREDRRDDRRDERRDDRRDERREDRREDRNRNNERHVDERGGQRDNWNNRGRYDQRRDRSRSPRDDNERGQRDRRQSPQRQRPQNRQRQRRHSHGDNETYEWGKRDDNDKHKKEPSIDPADKEKPNFGLSGALTEDTNKVNGVVVKYAEPPEARKPKRRWRLYPFKGETALPTLHIHRQSCFLVGRDRKVVDLAVDHPSCSKQHAALQYRLVPFQREDGTTGKRVRLYLIDLESANGTFLNNKKVDGRKYYELIEKDVIKFGFSTREYVLLHENSKEDQEDDDVDIKQEQADEPLEVPNP